MYASIGVYCTFNGLIVAAQMLARAGVVKKVGILDYDMHYGDGTDDIITTLGLDHAVVHYSAAREFRRPDQAARFLESVPGHVDRMRDCQVILYGCRHSLPGITRPF
jgi:acetoin utilization deacetylase AcuC-like enzyme